MLVAMVHMHFFDRIDGKATGCTWHSFPWRISFLLDHFDSVWLFSSTGLVSSLHSFLLNSILCSWKKCIQQLNHPLSESEQPCDALFKSICCFYSSWTVTYFERFWKNIAISASGKCFMDAGAVLKIELKFLLYRVFFTSLYIKHYTI